MTTEKITLDNPKAYYAGKNSLLPKETMIVGIMSRELGIYPSQINSSLVTAQLRDRYYWTNIKTKETIFDIVSDIPQPKDIGILLKDIVEHGFVDRDKARAILQSESRINTDMDRMYRRYGDGWTLPIIEHIFSFI